MENHTPSTEVALSPRIERAIAARDAIEGGARPVALVPRTFLEAQAFCGALAESELIPTTLKKRAPDILVIVLAGIELGMTPMMAIRLHHVIEGIPRLSADGIASIVLASPLCEYLECSESTELRATWITKRRGRPERSVTWTIERARRAGLADKKNRDGSPGMWMKYTENMLSSRAKAELCRIVYPDIAAGLVSREEAWDGGVIDAEFTEAPTVFTAPPRPVAVPPAAPANTNGAAAPAPEPPRRGRPPKDRTIEATATEPPAAKLDAAIAKVEQKVAAPPPVRAAPPAPPAAEPEEPELEEHDNPPAPPQPEPEDYTTTDADADFGEVAKPAPDLKPFFAWLATCRSRRDLSARKGEWIAWSAQHCEKDSEPSQAMRQAFAKRNAEVPE